MSFKPLALIALTLVAPIEWSVLYSRLPEYMATNFDGGGLPGGWMSRSAAGWSLLLMIGVSGALFLALPWLLRATPQRWLNLPNRDYWLAPERAAQTRGWLEDRVWLMGVATLVFLLFVNHLVLTANLEPEPRLSPAFLPAFALYMVLVVLWAVTLLLRFRRP